MIIRLHFLRSNTQTNSTVHTTIGTQWRLLSTLRNVALVGPFELVISIRFSYMSKIVFKFILGT